MSNPNGAVSSGAWRDTALAVQCGCAALVALGAAYASYRHGRDFALQFEADHTTAAIWLLIVDSLLLIVTVAACPLLALLLAVELLNRALKRHRSAATEQAWILRNPGHRLEIAPLA